MTETKPPIPTGYEKIAYGRIQKGDRILRMNRTFAPEWLDATEADIRCDVQAYAAVIRRVPKVKGTP